jgi:SulP family sulfate permease
VKREGIQVVPSKAVAPSVREIREQSLTLLNVQRLLGNEAPEGMILGTTPPKTHVLARIQSRQLFPNLAAGFVEGLNIVTTATAFAALIFSGVLAVYVPRGIGLMLGASMIIVGFTTVLSSIPWVVATLQDTVVAILAVVSAAIVNQMPASATGQEKLVTVVVAIALSSLLTGVLFLSIGQFKLGNLIRFIPYPVIGGFIAGSGLLLAFGAISFMAGAPINFFHLSPILQLGQCAKWLPGLLFAVFLLVVSRRRKHVLILPCTLMGGIVVFYVSLVLTNTPIAKANELGLLLGALPTGGGSLWQPLNLSDLAQVDWSVIGRQIPSLCAIAVVGIITLLLNATSLELVTGQNIDLNRELKAAGIANLVAGLAGGMVGFHGLSDSTVSYKMGARSRLVGFVVAALCGLTFLLGGALLSYFPNLVLGGFLLFLGLDFLVTWVYEAWFKLPITDYLIMIVILIAINTVGFLEGVGLGVVLAVILFVVNYSRINAVKHVLTGATYHSNVTRPRLHQQLLREKGDCLYILELQGLIFFGTAQKMLDMVCQRIDSPNLPDLRFLVLDFRLVNGFDLSALLGFAKIKQLAQARGIALVFTNLSADMQRQIKRELLPAGNEPSLQFFVDLDHGIEWCEDQMAASFVGVDLDAKPLTLMKQLKNAMPSSVSDGDLLSYFEEKKADKGEYIIHQGDDSAGLYFIEKGQVTVQLEGEGGKTTRLRTMQTGTVVGELGLYLGRKTTASVIADEPCTLFHLTTKKFNEMEKNAPEIASAFHKFIVGILGERLVDTNDTLQALVT